MWKQRNRCGCSNIQRDSSSRIPGCGTRMLWCFLRMGIPLSPPGIVLREGSIFVLDVWAAATGEKLAICPSARDAVEHAGTVSGVAFAPGGQLLASASQDHSDPAVGLRRPGSALKRLHGNPSEVWAVAFSADGRGIHQRRQRRDGSVMANEHRRKRKTLRRQLDAHQIFQRRAGACGHR